MPATDTSRPMGHEFLGAITVRVARGDAVLVFGDGAVGLCAVIAAKRMAAERFVLAGRREARTDLGREFGATDLFAERGGEGITFARADRRRGQGARGPHPRPAPDGYRAMADRQILKALIRPQLPSPTRTMSTRRRLMERGASAGMRPADARLRGEGLWGVPTGRHARVPQLVPHQALIIIDLSDMHSFCHPDRMTAARRPAQHSNGASHCG